ncbi:MocR family transcriptional regulator [Microbacterium mangrovi]|uniref:MocR family transcriptional regulator n=1 Tax=Microbacterium mangrovi TaxID=1348253 RepID=A0A0B2A9E4_9MICO|nr:PLP-dependent aminotransferase family protein [Microbacterium mangrovi]KHK98231.1 MocR family transcriptional regulator [Microbacterium mangrovi]
MNSQLSARALATMLGIWRLREPAYEALADAVRLLCLDGRIVARTGLPAERELAAELRVSRTTVASAYQSLRESGHIESRRGAGSVTLPATQRTVDFGSPREGIDLQRACPPAWPGLAALAAEVMQNATTFIGQAGYDMIGSENLRTAIADRYTQRGLPTTPDEILVTNGAQAAIHLIAAVMVGRADRVAIETPTYPHAADALRAAGARLVPLPVSSESGWDLDQAEQVFARTQPTLAYLMPVFQNPTGRSMSLEEREAFVDAAGRSGTVLVVDETTAELSTDDRPLPGPMLSDGICEIIHLGSLGKTVWGGLRVGWIRAAPDILSRLVANRPAFDLGTPDLDQAISALAIRRMDDILPQRHALLRAGRDALVDRLATALPTWRATVPDGGVSLWVDLGAPVSSALVVAAHAQGVHLTAGSRFGIGGGHDARLRIPFTATPDELRAAVEVLAEVWPDVSKRAGLAVRGAAPVDAVV